MVTNEEGTDLNKALIARVIEKIPNSELREALRVIHKHLAEQPDQELRNEASWGLGTDNTISVGLVFGIYRF